MPTIWVRARAANKNMSYLLRMSEKSAQGTIFTKQMIMITN